VEVNNMTQEKFFFVNGEKIKVSDIPDEVKAMSAEDVEELYNATRMIEADAAELFDADISVVDFDDDLDWIDEEYEK